MAPELTLEQLRDEIDKIDEVIVRLLDSRARCAYTVGRLKHELGRPIYEPAREAAVIAHVRQVNESLGGPLDERRVDLDTCIAAMALTAKEMNSKYKETSEGGLAVSLVLC